MSKPVLRALPVHRMAESRVRPAVVGFFTAIAPAYLRLAMRFRTIRLMGADAAIEAVRSFQDGKSRLLIAFRHPYGEEPQLIASLVARTIPASARRASRPLTKSSHAHFVHGYEVPLWSGAAIRWLLPRAGAVPVYHIKFDSQSVERLRRLMRDGPFPLALAPEGQVSYVSEGLPRLESGFAHLAFWCAEDLAKTGRTENVIVLPLSVHYRYGRDAPRVLAKLIASMEKDCGIKAAAIDSFARLKRLAAAIVDEAERFYRELDGGKPVPAPKPATEPASGSTSETVSGGVADGDAALNDRWSIVIRTALEYSERGLRLKPEGDIIQRVYRLRQVGWDRIYRADLPPPGERPPSRSASAGERPPNRSASAGDRPQEPAPLRRALWDREAAEAWYAMRHMELADIGFYIDFNALKENDPIERYMETANNYWDLISRLRGGNFSDRINPALKDAIVIAGEPLTVAAPAAENGGRVDRKALVAGLTDRLQQRFLDCIDIYFKEYRNGKH